MCSHYQTLKDAELLLEKFGVRDKSVSLGIYDVWPKLQGLFVRRPTEHDAGDDAVPEREAVVGRWGMIPPGTKPEKLAEANTKKTFNARSETAHQLWTFRNAWAEGQHCIIPADAIFEPDWRAVDEGLAKKSVATRFTRADGQPMGIAGLWDRYRDAAGQWQDSYTMLTMNADDHPLFKHYHQSGKEKRMVVILPEGAYGDWLTAPASDARDFLAPYPADRLVATPMRPGNPES
ncbi:putative SOS response-associated peptidase YedK [Achromobacter deleyi]|uniref:SOS response-associated peptidase n=1 Tax=Achromobacter deleyi TaxID=1353891 RepID=UPI0028609E12|nr:SOS response-associated peptidase family protein [Achromobacter deleyi]MDR6600966.1 putative SOS response-associated peptidase YedK [Achromobacter deleyi]